MNEPSNVAKVWLFLLEEGGPWEAHAIREQTGVKPEVLQVVLNSMSTRGHARRLRDKRPFMYEVDGSCIVPHGVTVEHLQKAGMRMAG
jgi:hypothetical protein